MSGSCRPALLFVLSLCAAFVGVAAGSVQAQRGQEFIAQEPASKGPGAGFPGLLDTEVARRGSVVFQAPAFTAQVGVTEHLTLGTNLLYDAISLSGNPGGLGWLRYRIRGTARFQATLDAIGGGFRIRSDSERTRHTLFVGISNNSWYWGDRHRLTLNVLVGNITVGMRDTSQTLDVAVQGLATGLTYRFRAARWCALSASLVPVPLLLGRAEDESIRADLNSSGASQLFERTIYRAMALFQAGDHWTFEVGGFGVGKAVLPWFSVGLRVGKP